MKNDGQMKLIMAVGMTDKVAEYYKEWESRVENEGETNKNKRRNEKLQEKRKP